MLDWLPDFLDGLFNMLSDSNREIRQAAGSAIGGFLIEIKKSTVVEFGPMVGILVSQCRNKERFNRSQLAMVTRSLWVKRLDSAMNLTGLELKTFLAGAVFQQSLPVWLS